ncbi:hypothetical protein CASFOL_036864 [Castilleja foliolosa]|uniref:[Histone H3]-trimethyl-L-lysine(4) demethylase n=1 Tax=Castilleja foliolosa TaxID=1961234 RepID=A0ABD3BQ15_9LAMI
MMGRGKTRKIEKGVLGGSLSSDIGSLRVPAGPVFFPTEEEFKDPLEYIYKIRPEAEPYGICKIVPPTNWKPPFALDKDSFEFPTKSQAIHQLQARCAACDPKTFKLEYNRFLEEECGKKAKKRVVFEGDDLDLCKLFNVVKRFGGYDSVVKTKKWAEVFRFIRPGKKISECSKHVLSQLYCEHLTDYEDYYCRLNKEKDKSGLKKCEPEAELLSAKRRRKNKEGERVEVRKVEEKEFDQICEQCRSGLHGEVMLLCDRCNKGWHIYCLSPPLKTIPPGNWYCLECLNSEKESFGFVPGKQYSVESFRRVAERLKKKWFGSVATSWVQLEKKFWEIVEGSVGEVKVMYGSDLDTSIYGSGFPRKGDERPSSVEVGVWDEYCSSPWNLNNLPTLQGSMLRAVHQNIAGVMVPWLYIGMLFSSFCWHFEDHCFYSMNYHHWGEPKCWYSVPGNKADAFEKVMRSSLPDLFEAQPDLLFQLVTMLNPSVLQEKGVPVYSIIQEPGNFVITFPRSYHGGFNFGLNCAEAVNFAPADWLPHGGFGAELYRHYRKVPVLSHEELLCVVAKSELDNRVSPFLKEELLRIYNNEKTWREKLWRYGIISSSRMTPRAKSEYVGTEEDPMCVICQQLLYLSAVSCNCRPSSYVCLEHWEHLCECKPNKLRLLFRHTLAELSELQFKVDSRYSLEVAGDSQKDMSSEKAVALAKKVKGGHVTHVQLAEEWILRVCKILENPYSRHAYVTAIEEAEQFIWAGPEMDLVREMQNNLIQARTLAKAVKSCLSKVKLWSSGRNCDTERLQMDDVNYLLSLKTVPCKVPGILLLKIYQEEANTLIQEINSALRSCSEYSVADLEILYAKTVNSPFHVKESEELKLKLSAVKRKREWGVLISRIEVEDGFVVQDPYFPEIAFVWLDNVRNCILQKAPSSVEVDMLYKLESEISELKFQLPEADLLNDLTRKVNSCRCRCNEILNDLVGLKEVELLVSEWREFPVNIPELELLKEYYSDTLSWMSRVDHVLTNVHEREDQEKVVDELTCIQKDGLLLKIQVSELPRIELELEKARCRVKAYKALRCQMPMDFIQQLMSEAAILQIQKEEIFTDISKRHAAAMCWDEKAKHLLATRARMSDFEDLLRDCEHISIVPPSHYDFMLAVSTAKAWLTKSEPFLVHNSSIILDSDSCLQVDVLKELVLESEDLNVHFEECSLLEKILKKSVEWEQDASTLLQNAEHLWNTDIVGEGKISSLIPKLECQVLSMETAMKSGISLGLQFNMIPKLQDAFTTLKWCISALSFTTTIPTHKEVETMLDAAASLPVINKSVVLWTALIDGLSWLRKSLKILDPSNRRQFQVSDLEGVLVLSKETCISYPMIIGRLRDAVHDHNVWLEQVHLFFGLSFEDRLWNSLMQLKERGSSKAFSCVELEKVLSEHEKVHKWKKRCDIIKPPSSENDSLLSVLIELKNTLERSFEVYINHKIGESRDLCICCSSDIEDHKLLTCSICEERFHLQCAETRFDDAVSMVCPYCNSLSSSKLTRSGSFLRAGKKHLALDNLTVLLSDANDLCLWTDERKILDEIVEKAHACSDCLTELVNFALAYSSKDLHVVTHKMGIALKAMDVAGIADHEKSRKFDLALATTSWKIRAEKLLDSAEKPTLQQIQNHLKEGLAMNILPEDYFTQKLTKLRNMALQWAETAKKVSVDGGMLGLDKVFQLISEGESLPVSCAKELKLLRDRSMLYCICRKPYDRRAMIACDKCDEWYHFDCVKISSAPKIYICPACAPPSKETMFASVPTVLERFNGSNFEEPQTPSRFSELKRSSKKSKSVSDETPMETDMSDCLGMFRSNEILLWRNRKPFRRVARKRSELQSLSPFFHVDNK